MADFATTEDGVHVSFALHGTGPALVFVHGLGDQRGVWSAVVARLQAHFTCVTLDLRGHGQSSVVQDYDPFGLTRDVAAVCTALQLDTPVLIGHSLGGFVATVYGARHPVRAVLNVDQPLHLAALSGAVRALVPRIRAGEVESVTWQILESIGLGPLPADTLAALRRTRARLAPETLLGIWHPLITLPEPELAQAVDAAITGLRAPFLAVHGAALPHAYGAWLRQRIPQAQIEEWTGVGHFPHLACPERLAARIVELAHA